MERNEDPKIVVMDRRVYDQLRYFADKGASSPEDEEEFDEIERHIRKFNVELMKLYKSEQIKEAQIKKAERAKTYEFSREWGGKRVFLVHDRINHKYQRAVLLGVVISEDGSPFLRLRLSMCETTTVFLWRVVTSLPEEYVLGYYDRSWKWHTVNSEDPVY